MAVAVPFGDSGVQVTLMEGPVTTVGADPTVMVTGVDTAPAETCAYTVYTLAAWAVVGVPVMAPVALLKDIPSGSAGEIR